MKDNEGLLIDAVKQTFQSSFMICEFKLEVHRDAQMLIAGCLIHTWLQPGDYSAKLTGNRLNGFPVHCTREIS